ncbi:hypothetical protein BDZ91DRAFT_747022, partial [Kalaharituber pfeilii]
IPRLRFSPHLHVYDNSGQNPVFTRNPPNSQILRFLKLTSAAEHLLLSQHLRSLSTPLNTVHPLNTIYLLIQLIKFYQM